ncbi:SH3 domain-containing protein [Azoarcus sp. PA01]|nr:SH3 domain-containing protein [Azoarcus sp. PA01]
MPSSVTTALLGALATVVLHVEAQAASAEPCGSGSTKSGQILRVNGSDVALRSAPNAKNEKLINQKATQILKTTNYLTIDNTVTVVEECTQGEWSRVRVKEPDWLQNSHIGWVQSSSLRSQRKDSGGIVEFTETDFVWDKKTSPHKKAIIAGVNKVHRENSRCKTIDPGTAYISSSKGSPSDPVFYVTCGTGAGAFNAFYSKSEVEKGATMAAAKHIDRGRAIELCESYAKTKTNHPSTFSFSRAMDLAVNEHPNGRTTVNSSFTAKNSFNLELKHSIRCLLDSTGLIEANISEAK